MCEETKNCNCGCEEEFDDQFIMLQDEDGNEVAFRFVYEMEYEGKDYVFLQAAEGEDLDVLEIYELEEGEEGMDNLYPVEDEVYETLYELLMKEVENSGCDCGCEDHCDCDCDDDCDCDCHE